MKMSWKIWSGNVGCGPDNQTLRVNQACLNITSSLDIPLKFYTRNLECLECNYKLEKYLEAPTSFIIDTRYGIQTYLTTEKNNSFCEMTNHFEDFGIYSFHVSENYNCSEIVVLQEPEKFWLNMSLLICLYLSVWALYKLFKFIYNKSYLYFSSSRLPLLELETDLGVVNNRGHNRLERNQKHLRVQALDAFRGFAIFLMIFVNYGGGEYSVFKHTPWNGLTIADLIFPWFVWIMGASISLSVRSHLRSSKSKTNIFSHILTRSIVLVFLGIILNSGHRENSSLRVCGVLQRLGVTYFIVASIEILFTKSQGNEQFSPWYFSRDIVDSWVQMSFAIFFAVVHTVITFTLNVPGCPTGYLGPGGLSDHGLHKNCTGGAAGYIDRIVITDAHMYHRGTFVNIFKPLVAYDPEGLLGTLTSITCALLGVSAARIILNYENSFSRIRKWLMWAVVTGISCGFLCSWSQNDGIIPINKNLWSLSFVLASSSLAFLILATLYWWIDFTHIWSGFPFIYPGKNAITLYLGHSLLKNQLPWKWLPFTNTHFELLVMDAFATTIWLLISYLLYTYNIFITL